MFTGVGAVVIAVNEDGDRPQRVKLPGLTGVSESCIMASGLVK
jgi:hypothetical protein